MAYRKRKTYRKKRRVAKRKTRNNPLTVNISRSTVEICELNVTSPPTGWTSFPVFPAAPLAIGKSFKFALVDLNEITDFTRLFAFYKINSVNVKIYLSNTGSNIGNNAQLLCRYDINSAGVTLNEANELNYLDSQTSRTKLCLSNNGRPIQFNMKMKIASNIYNSTINTDYAVKNPTWISTAEPNAAHFGMNVMFQRVDNEALSQGSSVYQTARIEYRYNMSFKKVQ